MKYLIYDIETDSLDTEKAELKWFGGYDYLKEKYHYFDHTQIEEINKFVKQFDVFIGFNNKSFDQPICENNGIDFGEYKTHVDLFEVSAPLNYGRFNKNALAQAGVTDLNNYSLNEICKVLKLDTKLKGDIDYNIFKKDKWTSKEVSEIKKYLKQDLVLTTKLLDWYYEEREPLKKLISKKDAVRLKHINSSSSSLAYKIACNQVGTEAIFSNEKPIEQTKIEGGHHIIPRWKQISGNIIAIDFVSAYPHAIMMGNLCSPVNEGWDGGDYFKLKGKYNIKEKGKFESALENIFTERLKAKSEKDDLKNKAYKIIINSFYGTLGNYKFKKTYNPISADDCTKIVRTLLKKAAKTLEENDFTVLYGFTDGIYVLVPNESSKEELQYVVNNFIEEAKSQFPFPMESFKMDIEKEIKFVSFFAKNVYLYVDDKDKVHYTSTLFNKNTPKVVLDILEEYMKPQIVLKKDARFQEQELKEQLIKYLDKNPELAAEEYKVSNISEYKAKTSLQYQISEKYGEGTHLLIPNLAGIGIGKGKDTKKKKARRYCTLKEFKSNKLTSEDIDLQKILQHFKPFTNLNEEVKTQ